MVIYRYNSQNPSSPIVVVTLPDIPLGAVVHRELGGEHYISLPFSLATAVTMKVGDYCDVEGFGRFVLTKPYIPKYNQNTLGYDYKLQLDAEYMKWKNRIVKYSPTMSASETSFHLTANIYTHLGVITAGLAALGNEFKYHGTTAYTFSLVGMSQGQQSESKYKYYQNTDFISALSDLANIFECDWWVEESVIYFGSCRIGTNVDFTIDDNVAEMNSSDSSKVYANRLYAFGSTRNLHQNYRRVLDKPFTIGYRKKIYANKVTLKSLDWTCPTHWFNINMEMQVVDSSSPYNGKILPFRVISGNYISPNASVGSDAWNKPVFELYDIGFYEQEGSTVPFTSNTILQLIPGDTQSQIEASIISLESFTAFDFSDIVLNENALNSQSTLTQVNNSGYTTFAYAGVLVDLDGNLLNSGKPIFKSISNQTFPTATGVSVELSNLNMAHVSKAYTIPDYGETDVVQDGVVEKRLMLPHSSCPNGYVQVESLSEQEVIETVAVVDEIYPKVNMEVGRVDTYPDTKGEVTQTFYQLIPTESSFANWMIIENQTLHIVFTSGKMLGMDFECYHSDDEGYFEVKVNDNYGRPLPDVSLHPEVGDTFVLTGWDASLNDGMIEVAEQELYDYSVALLAKLKEDSQNYTCKMMSYVYEQAMRNGNTYNHYPIGQIVTLKDSSRFGSSGRVSRVMGYDINLDFQYDEPVYIVGEAATYSRFDDLQSKIDGMKFTGASYGSSSGGSSGGGSSVNVVQTTGVSEEDVMSQKAVTQTVNNVYNALEEYDEVVIGVLMSAVISKTYKFVLDPNETTYRFVVSNNNGSTILFSSGDIMGITTAEDLVDAIKDVDGYDDFAKQYGVFLLEGTVEEDVDVIDGEDYEIYETAQIVTFKLWSIGNSPIFPDSVSLTKGVNHVNTAYPYGYVEPKENDGTGDKEFYKYEMAHSSYFVDRKRTEGVLYINKPVDSYGVFDPNGEYSLWTWNGSEYVPLSSNVEIEVDDEPTEGSENAVSSGGVWSEFQINNKIFLGTCSTSASTVDKVVTTETFKLASNGKPTVGTVIGVKFSATNTATAPTLNVNSTGAASIYYNNAVYTAASNIAGYKNRYTYYVWDGTYWVWLSQGTDANTTYSSMTAAEISAGTGTTARLITPANLKVAIETYAPQADWSASSGAAAILNKPALSAVATSGSYNDLSDKPSLASRVVIAPTGSLTINGTTYSGYQLYINCIVNETGQSNFTFTREDMATLGFSNGVISGIISKTYLRVCELWDSDQAPDSTYYKAYEVVDVKMELAANEEDYYVWFVLRADNIRTWSFQGFFDESEGTSEWTMQYVKLVDSALDASSTNPVQNKKVYEALQGKQNTLVSGTNIATINGNNLLNGGNIVISGGTSLVTYNCVQIFNTPIGQDLVSPYLTEFTIDDMLDDIRDHKANLVITSSFNLPSYSSNPTKVTFSFVLQQGGSKKDYSFVLFYDEIDEYNERSVRHFVTIIDDRMGHWEVASKDEAYRHLNDDDRPMTTSEINAILV